MKRRTPEQIEHDEGTRAWRIEQARLTSDMTRALARYTQFHAAGFEAWFEKWKVRRRIK